MANNALLPAKGKKKKKTGCIWGGYRIFLYDG